MKQLAIIALCLLGGCERLENYATVMGYPTAANGYHARSAMVPWDANNIVWETSGRRATIQCLSTGPTTICQ